MRELFHVMARVRREDCLTPRRGRLLKSLSEKDVILPNEPILKKSQLSIKKRLKAGFGRSKGAPKRTQTNPPEPELKQPIHGMVRVFNRLSLG
ncbi:MAG TPA: hypothetical protein VL970_08680, partial [Candidatus Acidoferrales bacterium]|nr:hypothetical protein [Candidatus Acidoferrales bacterium]